MSVWRNTKTSKLRGFTLVELLAAVAIVGVIATLALPRYRAQVARGRQAEATTNLGTIHKLQESYFMDTDDGTNKFHSGLYYGLDKCGETPAEALNGLGFRLTDCSKSRYRYITNTNNDQARSDGCLPQGQVYPNCNADDEWSMSRKGKLANTDDVLKSCPSGGNANCGGSITSPQTSTPNMGAPPVVNPPVVNPPVVNPPVVNPPVVNPPVVNPPVVNPPVDPPEPEGETCSATTHCCYLGAPVRRGEGVCAGEVTVDEITGVCACESSQPVVNPPEDPDQSKCREDGYANCTDCAYSMTAGRCQRECWRLQGRLGVGERKKCIMSIQSCMCYTDGTDLSSWQGGQCARHPGRCASCPTGCQRFSNSADVARCAKSCQGMAIDCNATCPTGDEEFQCNTHGCQPCVYNTQRSKCEKKCMYGGVVSQDRQTPSGCRAVLNSCSCTSPHLDLPDRCQTDPDSCASCPTGCFAAGSWNGHTIDCKRPCQGNSVKCHETCPTD